MKYILPLAVLFLVLSIHVSGQNAICQDIEVQLGPDGTVEIDPMLLDNGSTGTAPLNMFVEPPILNCENIGSNTVTLYVMDSSGSTNQCDASVLVMDDMQPTVICNDIDSLGVNEIITLEDIGIAFDNCQITQTIILPTSFDQPGDYTASLIAFDIGGSATTCVSFVTVVGDGNDNEPPTITNCPLEITRELDFSCEYELEDLSSLVSAEDNLTNSNDLTYAQFPMPGTEFFGNTIQNVSIIVTDEAGLNSTCNFQIFLQDITPPSIVNCPLDQVELLDESFVIPDYTSSLTAFDNCSDNFDLIINQSIAEGTVIDSIGVHEILITAEDESGNTAFCSFNLNLYQDNVPVAVCQDIDVELNMDGQVAISPSMINAGSVAAEPYELLIDVDQFDCTQVGGNFVTLTVAGPDGNNASCQAMVTVLDTQDPMLICQDLALNLMESDSVMILASNLVEFSVDNCEIISTSLSQSTFTSEDLGENIVTVTMMDPSGNIGTCVSLVTLVEEDLPPTAICSENIELLLDETGNVVIDASIIDNGSTDDVGIASVTIDEDTFDCSVVGSNEVILMVEDNGGNISMCITTVIILDEINPTIECSNTTISLGDEGETSVSPETLVLNASDECGIDVYTLSQYDFNTEDFGDNEVEVSATDVNGNTSSCTSIVTIITEGIPALSCPSDMSMQGDENCSLILPDFQAECTAVNFCNNDSIIYTQEPAPGTEISGTTEIAMTVLDDCGFTATCNFTLTVSGLEVSVDNTDGILSTDVLADNYQWYNCGGNPIPNANQATYAPEESGSYYVTVISNGCSGSSDCEDVIFANVEELAFDYEMNLYPNPSDGKFSFIANSGRNVSLTASIYNNLGQLILTKNISTNELVLFDMENESSGLYYIQIHGNYQTNSRTFTIR